MKTEYENNQFFNMDAAEEVAINDEAKDLESQNDTERAEVREIWLNQLINALKCVFGPDDVERCDSKKECFKNMPVIDTPYFWIDADYGEKASVRRTLKRAERKDDLERPLVAITQTPHQRTIVSMYIDDFLTFLDDVLNYQPEDLK